VPVDLDLKNNRSTRAVRRGTHIAPLTLGFPLNSLWECMPLAPRATRGRKGLALHAFRLRYFD